MAAKLESIQELQNIAIGRGFEPPTYTFETEDKLGLFKCRMKFFAYTIEATATSQDESLNVCCKNMLLFWKCSDAFKIVCTKDMNITIDYDEYHNLIEDEKRREKEAELNAKIKNTFNTKEMDPVAYLYEFAKKTNTDDPKFIEAASSDGLFLMQCNFMGKTSKSTSISSKKVATTDAALKMINLIELDIPTKVELTTLEKTENCSKNVNFIGKLQELAIKENEAPPLFMINDKLNSRGEFEAKCTYLHITLTGFGSSKKQAKSAAAAKVFYQLQSERLTKE